jgi:hypothetical protein
MVVLNMNGPSSATGAILDAPSPSPPQPLSTSSTKEATGPIPDAPLAAVTLMAPSTAILDDDVDDDIDDDDDTATRGATLATTTPTARTAPTTAASTAVMPVAAEAPPRLVTFDAKLDDGDGDGDPAIGACSQWWDRTWRACCQRGSFVDRDITFAQFVATAVSDYVG